MRRIVFLLVVVAGLVSPSWAANKAQTVTVAQLGQWLTGVHGQPDGKVTKGLGSMVLTERVSASQLAQWQSDLPGRHSQDALTALADTSILHPSPRAELLADPPPDLKAQGDMLSRAIDYVAKTLGKLPDFSAMRTTEHFEDNPARDAGEHIFTAGTISNAMVGVGTYAGGIPQVLHGEISSRPLHLTGQSTLQVSYRDGVEMRGAEKMDRAAINQPEPGLTTAGEFGPILSVVLDDAMHGSVEWGYWEQGPRGRVAVFSYRVADGHSNYVLALKLGHQQERLFPAYHGEITIDPVTGAVLRITVVSSSLRSQDVMESAIVVDYGPVQLGGKDSICPLKGVAILKTVPDNSEMKTQINDATFTDYHVMPAM